MVGSSLLLKGESQWSLQRTGHDDRVHPSSKPLGVPAWQVQY